MVALPRFLVNFELFNILAATLVFVKSLDPDQDRRNVRPALDPNITDTVPECIFFFFFLKTVNLKKISCNELNYAPIMEH